MTKPHPLFQQYRPTPSNPASGEVLKDLVVGKIGYLVVQTTGEDAKFWPFTIPSPEEQAAAKQERAREAARERLQVEQRLAKAHPALQPVIAHHSPAEHGFLYSWTCKGCDTGAYAEDSPGWPCSTLELILEGL